ncbi:protein kinase [Spirillospora sp. NPDC049652]
MPDTTAPPPGDTEAVGPYRLERRLGTGGQGTVHAARGPDGRRVALKLLHPHLVADERARSRFLGEVEIAKRVAPFCTAPVLDSGIDGDRPYIVSEFVDGPSLHASVRTSGPRSGAALHRLAVNTASALAAIHEAGVVHRDFKPGNVLLGPDGPVVIDFGIARALDLSQSLTTSQAVGSPAYMAPEQIANGEVGPAADLFAWAATLVYAATGRRAFSGGSIPGVMHAILNDEPDLPDLDPPLRDIVRACFAKDPAVRPTAVAVLESLRGPSRTAVASTLPDDPSAPSRTTADAPAGETAADSAETAAPAVETAADLRETAADADERAAGLPAGGVASTKASSRSRRRGVLLAAAVALLVLLASGAAYMAGTSGSSPRSGDDKAAGASGPAPGSGGASPTAGGTTPASTPKPSANGKKTPSSGPTPGGTPSRPANPPAGGPSRPSGKTNPPAKNGGATPPHKSGPRTLGTVSMNDMNNYCSAQGYANAMKQGDAYYCVIPGAQPTSWDKVCRWRYSSRSGVYADGTTCKSAA